MRKLYMLLGIIMVIIGFLILSLYYYFVISSVLVAAFGLSAIVLGYTSISLTFTRPHISPETEGIFLRINNTLLISLTAEFVIINILLTFFKQHDLIIYLIIGVIVYLITVWFYVALNPELRNALTAVCAAVFAEFLIIITIRIIDILK